MVPVADSGIHTEEVREWRAAESDCFIFILDPSPTICTGRLVAGCAPRGPFREPRAAARPLGPHSARASRADRRGGGRARPTHSRLRARGAPLRRARPAVRRSRWVPVEQRLAHSAGII